MNSQPSFTIGLEEEYLLVDCETRDAVSDPPPEILQHSREDEGERFVEPELLRSQIEVNTQVCKTAKQCRDNLAHLRRTIIHASREFGMAPIAASTHPFAKWQLQQHTHKERYEMLSENMRSLARRALVCGMHVHVGIEDDEQRIKLMNQFTPYLPLLLALSTSSPFWEGQDTGLKSHRLPVFDGFPRTGLPERYDNYNEYRHHIETLQKTGVIKDATVLWWDLRPSDRYPTLEVRIMDMCTDIDDAISIAALIHCLMHYLYRHRNSDPQQLDVHRFLVDQNRWRAIRYGYDLGMIDFTQATITPVSELLDELIEMLTKDAIALDCEQELQQIKHITQRGTSAHQQLNIYYQAIEAGETADKALNRVIDFLIQQTAKGL